MSAAPQISMSTQSMAKKDQLSKQLTSPKNKGLEPMHWNQYLVDDACLSTPVSKPPQE